MTFTESPAFPGLSSAEVEASRRLAGSNILVPRPRGERLLRLVSIVSDPMALMLAATAGVYLSLGEKRDGLIMAAALVPVLGVDVLLEAKSRRALAALAGAVAPQARVVRNGSTSEIAATEVVPGDVLLLEEGDVVAADGILFRAANLSIDESPLTGESVPAEKRESGDSPQAESEVTAGSTVLTGSGAVRVIATGARTRFASIARQVSEATNEPTPLQKRVSRLIKPLFAIAALIAVVVLILALVRGETFGVAFLGAISFAMAAFPEEFPLVLTLFLATGAWRLGRSGVLVRKLAAVETLGSTTVLCVDKTGTLTAGRFVLDEHVPFGTWTAPQLLEAAVRACENEPPDPLELAILHRAKESGIDPAALRVAHPMIRDYDFDPRGKHMSHVRQSGDGTRVDAKGSLEGILEHCSIEPPERAAAVALEASLASRGMRVLAVAGKNAVCLGTNRIADESGLTLLGLLAFRDPLRPEVPAAIAQLRSAGIQVKILTGDHALTARAIAIAAGLDAGDGSILTGAEIDALQETELIARVRAATVIARVRPEQKNAIVKALRKSGEIVAMTGDGINDAPALKSADIGISMGRRATAVARAAADLVLLDDRFPALVETVREGRSIHRNLQRAFLYLIAFHVPIVVLALAAPLAGLPLLLLPVHLVWLELVVHPVSALVFEAERPDEDLLRIPPRRAGAPLLGRHDTILAIATGLTLTVAVFALFLLRLPAGVETARALALATLLIGTLVLVFVTRASACGLVAAGFPPTWRARIVVAGVLASIPVAIQIPRVSSALAMAPLPSTDWAIAASLALVSAGWRALLPRNSRRTST